MGLKTLSAQLDSNLGQFESYPLECRGGAIGAYRFRPRTTSRKEIVLCAHGLGCDAFYPLYGVIADALNLGYEVVSFDLPGHGVQGEDKLSRQGMQAIVDDVLSTVYGERERPAWFGISYSMGAWTYLLAHKERLRGCRGLFMLAPAWRSRFALRVILFEGLFSLTHGFWAALKELGFLHMWPSFGRIRVRRFPLRLTNEYGRYPLGAVRFVNALSDQVDTSFYRSLDIERWIITASYDRLVFADSGVSTGFATHERQYRETHWTLPFSTHLRREWKDFLIRNQDKKKA